ncbi:MAG: hypothetical protein GY856_19810, partial [bacterium]|nr:hypothetical protein [bacterium]
MNGIRNHLVVVALLVGWSLSGVLAADDVFLRLHVRDTSDRPLAGVVIGVRGIGSTEPTDRNGIAKLRLASGTKPKPDAWVTLQLRPQGAEGRQDWAFISPWDARVPVAPFADEAENFAPIVLGRRGDRELLTNRDALKAMTASILEELNSRGGKDEITAEDRRAVLEEQAASFGLSPEEVDQAIRSWSERARDPFDKGLAALYAKNYPEAEESLKASLEVREKSLERARAEVIGRTAEVVEAARFLGQTLRLEGKYRESVE